MTIEYKTEGKVLISCERGNSKHVALTWLKGGLHAKLHSGPQIIELSKSQLEQIAEHASQICNDLI